MRLSPNSFSIMISFLLRSDDDRKCSLSFPLFKIVFILLNKELLTLYQFFQQNFKFDSFKKSFEIIISEFSN